MTRVGVDRFLQFAFERARRRPKKHLTSTKKSNPSREAPSLFEPVHGSAPDLAGQGIANPIGQIWCGSMMLDHLGHPEAAAHLLSAIEAVLAHGPTNAPLTPDLHGTGTTAEPGHAITECVRET